MTTCIHMTTDRWDDETFDMCKFTSKVCLLMSGEKCEAQEESEEETHGS